MYCKHEYCKHYSFKLYIIAYNDLSSAKSKKIGGDCDEETSTLPRSRAIRRRAFLWERREL